MIRVVGRSISAKALEFISGAMMHARPLVAIRLD